ncbi:uncharacterized protein MAM_02005 [Metarhizium album ARSEF 1941]|uniref:Siderophore biosynthesis enzyme n=1 Tax=Metarhizium album (strain ARSEF 1941) TaxID=1081103 RepID=A0A0B2WVE0_METAS|nr:uncharacterized protein MAM_02005 [Metarhizium album ARSEF 1941]KHO00082.1 hypothetical protein MAM_02005 [Metarhizium album ARSEF 1941]
MAKTALSVLLPLLLTGGAAAFGCQYISYTTCADHIVHWYDPDDGRVCDPHDCGGGRAPPRKDVPGCAFYTGTESLRTEPSYLPCWTPSTAAVAVSTDRESSVGSWAESTPTNTDVDAPSKEMSTGSSAPASTAVSVVPLTRTTASSSSVGSVSDGVAAPPSTTTLPAALSTTPPASGATTPRNGTGNNTALTATGDAGSLVGGSKMALVAGVIGGFAVLRWA